MPKSIPAILKFFRNSTTIFNPPNRLKTFTTATSPYSVPKEKVDCVVIGAGVVGIAIARELASKGREVLVIESATTFGTGTSSRNSEVVHAGIYYPTDSLKAHFCVKGREMLYKYCIEHGVPHKQIGKLIVATRDSEVPKLNELLVRGVGSGVGDLRIMEASEAMSLEPELQCVKALMSPGSGIVDTHSLMLSLLGEAENKGATFSYNTTVLGGLIEFNQIHLHVTGSQNLENWNEAKTLLLPELVLVPKVVVNSAGLAAVTLAKHICGLDDEIIPPAYYARGCYFNLSKTKLPFRHLIYPIPEDGGLGVHATLDLNGQVKFGPDVEWIGGIDDSSSFLNKFDYSVCPDRMEQFYPKIRKYFPGLKDGALVQGYAGIRPKISGPGQTPADFIVQGEDIHGVVGLVNLFGIESPGLTSSLAIAEHIALKYFA